MPSRSDFVNFHRAASESDASPIESAVHPQSQPLPHDVNRVALEWILNPSKNGKDWTERILARLIQAEAHEVNPHLRDDYRQAFITLSLARDGSPIPFVEASYRVIGLHPDKVWPSILARRKALLGPEYCQLRSVPKKPSESETRDTKEETA
jgi:hypothetical protein